MNIGTVLTTINTPSLRLVESLKESNESPVNVIVIGDTKTSNEWTKTGFTFLDLQTQHQEFGKFSETLRINHYARKNIGYLKAAKMELEWIFETDDDNFLISPPEKVLNKNDFEFIETRGEGWINFYNLFKTEKNSEQIIWPRGYPLEEIHKQSTYYNVPSAPIALLMQGLANGNPDVDAIYRLMFPEETSWKFLENRILILNSNQIAPINSQTTLWNEEIYRLMYLPSFSTFRVTDILRGYIASHCLQVNRIPVGFFSPLVFQDRNEHNLIKDFQDEIPLFLKAKEFVQELSKIGKGEKLTLSAIMVQAYKLAINHHLTTNEELECLNLWLHCCDELGIQDF
jgi:hypothetical protein